MHVQSKARAVGRSKTSERHSRAALCMHSKPNAFWSGSAGGPAVPSLAWQICVAHSWQSTVATVHQIYEQIICEKKLQKDDSVIVFYWNPQTY